VILFFGKGSRFLANGIGREANDIYGKASDHDNGARQSLFIIFAAKRNEGSWAR
jgi:hypothetical protein